ncbi:MAG TPA: FAD-dependent oxidoreductase, partial [Actinomycetes bacterium]|nr:FAD-dependent oxidoreductase [Actinomycetes bacterium]
GSAGELAQDPTVAHAEALISQAARFFPALLGARVARMTLAWRAMPADRVPIVGPAAGLPWLYLAIPRGGVTIAPALGRLVAAELLDGTADALLAPLRPGRFADRAAQVMRDVETVFQRPPCP